MKTQKYDFNDPMQLGVVYISTGSHPFPPGPVVLWLWKKANLEWLPMPLSTCIASGNAFMFTAPGTRPDGELTPDGWTRFGDEEPALGQLVWVEGLSRPLQLLRDCWYELNSDYAHKIANPADLWAPCVKPD